MTELTNEFGRFSSPDNNGAHIGVLALGGSEGGIPNVDHLVAEGFACLAFAYHRHPGLPGSLVEIPVERVRDALGWLVDRDDVVTPDGRAQVVGVSKGAELALLAASLFPDLVGSVVAYTPSSVVWQGLERRWWRYFVGRRSSWSFEGRPLPFVPYGFVRPRRSERGMAVGPLYEAGLRNARRVAAATIEVERTHGPMLLISGGDDHMWPATLMCRMVIERMHAHARNDVRHLEFPDAGHILFPFDPSSIPKDAPRMDLGGSPETARRAHEQAWPLVVAHLRSGSR